MKCSKCQNPMHKVDRRDEMAELDDDATDGQMADYFATELSGDSGAWNLGIVESRCPKCNLYSQIVNDELPSYYPLIEGWHEKSSEGDTFSRFLFQYLAFIAHIKNNLFFDARSDRHAIQRLKIEGGIAQSYLETIIGDDALTQFWNEVITELDKKPLHNSSADADYPTIDKWWNSTEDQPNMDSDLPEGRVLSLKDWPNMVEYWYSVRDNLFHGGKNPNAGRDAFLVEHAFQTLRPLVELELKKG
jgi:hypothetical protein